MNRKIVHIINDLRRGGTNNCFYNLLEHSKKNAVIICINKRGYYYEKLKVKGYKIYYLENTSIINFLKSFIKILQVLKKENKSILHCWLYKSCIFGGLISFIFNYKKIIWNIRHSDTKFDFKNLKKHLTIKICILMSNLKKINVVFNSFDSMISHKRIGLKSSNMKIIHNGFNTKKYKFINVKDDFFNEYKINKKAFLISMYARFNPIKNHYILLESFSKILNYFQNIHLFLAGKDINDENIQLKNFIEFFNLKNNITLAGLLDEKELVKAYSSSDLTVLTSNSESFPNVIGESMSCSTPCVSFDVGDCRKLIGDTGWITKNNNSSELIKTLEEAINCSKKKDNWQKIKENCRIRIQEMYSCEKEFRNYENFYRSLN